jgi:predicted DNA-binding transcriptional regulator YafY
MRIDRLLSIIILLLNRDLVRARELARRFGVTVRTIQRDMQSLQEAGIPIVTIQGPNGGYGIMNTWKLDRQLITIDDLFYMLTALGSIKETLPDDGLDETLEKVRTLLPAEREGEIDERRQRLYVDFSMLAGRRRDDAVFDVIHRAVDQCRVLQIDYVDSKLERTTRAVEPMTLVFRWRSWYLYAFCLLRNDYRLFRMSRIENPVLIGRRFVRRDRPVERYLEDLDRSGSLKGIKLVLKFDKRMASLVKDVFADSVTEECEDAFIVRTSMPEDGWLYGFLLSFGTFLEVLEPAHLRRILAAEGEKIAELYAKDP